MPLQRRREGSSAIAGIDVFFALKVICERGNPDSPLNSGRPISCQVDPRPKFGLARSSFFVRASYIRRYHDFPSLSSFLDPASCPSYQPTSTQDSRWSTRTALNPTSTLSDRIPQISPFSTNHFCLPQPHSLPLPKVHRPRATRTSLITLQPTLPPFFPSRRNSPNKAILHPGGPSLSTRSLSSGLSLLLPSH